MNPRQTVDHAESTLISTGIGAIAAGQVGAAAGFIGRTIGDSIPIVLTFLGKVIVLKNTGGRIKATVMRLRARLDAVVDRIITWVKKVVGTAGTGVTNAADETQGLLRGVLVL